MLPISTKDLVRFTPPGHENEAEPPVYLLAVPTYRDVIKWRHAVFAEGARFPDDAEAVACVRAGVKALVALEEQGSLLETLEQYEAAAEEPKPEELRAGLKQIADAVRPYWPELQRLEALRGFWLELAPLLAAQMFLRGWENLPIAFERRGGLVPDALIERLGRQEAALIGFKAMALIKPGGDALKNSAPPSRSPSSPPPTAEEPSPPTAGPAGRSAASAMNGTRVSL